MADISTKKRSAKCATGTMLDLERRTWTLDEAAVLIGCSRSLLYAEAKRGNLPGLIRLGDRLLISRAAVERLLEGASRASRAA
jgi:excisionase family DNA binding protein